MYKNKFLFSFARLQSSTVLYSAKIFFYHIVIVYTSELESKNFLDSLFEINKQIKIRSLNLKDLNLYVDFKIFENKNIIQILKLAYVKGHFFLSYFKSVLFEA